MSVVPANQLGQWLTELPVIDVDHEALDAVWSAVLAHVRKRDAWSLEHDGPPHQPVMNRLVRSVLGPMVAALAALYAAATVAQSSFPVLVCELVVGLVALRLQHHKTLGPSMAGWATANALMLAALAVLVAINAAP